MEIWFFVFGCVFGSFANVLIYRLPLGKSVFYPPSHCIKCGKKLKFYHNIPLISWIFLRAKCAYCGQKISFMYFFVEFVSGILMVFAYVKFGANLSAFMIGICFILLLALSIIDIKFKAVPEILLFFAYIFALFAFFDTTKLIETLSKMSFYGTKFVDSLILAGALTMIKTLASLWKNRNNNGEILEVMGDGDTIIVALIGAILGAKLGLISVFLSAFLTIPFFIYTNFIKKQQNFEMPLIPFLAFGLILTLIFCDEILAFYAWYFQLLRF